MTTFTLNYYKDQGREPLAFVGPGIVDDKLSLIVMFPDETLETRLPATFEGYPVLIKYGDIELASNPQVYHEILKPGISIGRSEAEDAFTLGAFFQTGEKKCILTAGHSVGEVCNEIIQPGNYENDPDTSPCAKVTFKFRGINEDGNHLDYAFCEVNDCLRVSVNKPPGSETVIHNCKGSVSNDPDDMSYVYKSGRTSYLTKGIMIDEMVTIHTKLLGKVSRMSILLASDIKGQQLFGRPGDSGSAVFDDDGNLWGIYCGFSLPYHFVIPIHLILNDARTRYDVDFTLI
ncbi:hypothetical protein RclHR1_04780011 [Rhizophagus clarus]|uniref:Peptidase S1 domain-containing protein n=1 Tax=Rhizophagus clarus TaxID=94130 RepID=A0A2Z6RKA9_9GLOM|nr:hypothetical protein RclHR1_04780011 [Rhizophagus clarus]GES87931.1 hypothetical protein GLOIN_2v1476492 [Rhizophagus clarus]